MTHSFVQLHVCAGTKGSTRRRLGAQWVWRARWMAALCSSKSAGTCQLALACMLYAIWQTSRFLRALSGFGIFGEVPARWVGITWARSTARSCNNIYVPTGACISWYGMLHLFIFTFHDEWGKRQLFSICSTPPGVSDCILSRGQYYPPRYQARKCPHQPRKSCETLRLRFCPRYRRGLMGVM